MDNKRIVLRFPKEVVEKPVISQLAKNYNISFSILKAAINSEEGVMLLEITGDKDELLSGIEYLKNNKVIIEKFTKDVKMNQEKCVSCGACVTICPTNALARESDTFKILFDSEKCVACELCVKGCPYRAMEVHF